MITFTTRRTNKPTAAIAMWGFTLSTGESRTGYATEGFAAEDAAEMAALREANPMRMLDDPSVLNIRPR